jgi:hypothetical protein
VLVMMNDGMIIVVGLLMLRAVADERMEKNKRPRVMM